MNARDNERMRGALNQEAFQNAIRDNLSPEGVAAIIAVLQTASNYRNGTAENEQAINQVVWLRDMLLDMIGVEEFNRIVDEIGL